MLLPRGAGSGDGYIEYDEFKIALSKTGSKKIAAMSTAKTASKTLNKDAMKEWRTLPAD